MFNRTNWLLIVSVVFTSVGMIFFPTTASFTANKLVAMPAFGDIQSFAITADGKYVVFSADLETDGFTELYSIPLGGGTPTKLSTGKYSFSFMMSPDGQKVVFLQDDQIYTVPVTGPANAGIQISDDTLNSSGYYYISPDSQWIVYMVDEPGNYYFVTALYSVPITGGAKTQLNKDLVAGGSINYYNLLFSPDSQYVVYGADQDTVNMDELYSVPIGGPDSAGVKLNKTLPDGGNVELWWEYAVSPDSSRVVYRADQDTLGQKELYSVPIAGPANTGVKLNGALLAESNGVKNFQITPDSQKVIYLADQENGSIEEIYMVPILGGTPVKLNHTMEYDAVGLADEVESFSISPDSSTVVYQGSWVNHIRDPFNLTFEVYELFSIPITGTVRVEQKLWTPPIAYTTPPPGYPNRWPSPGAIAMNAVNHPICDMIFDQTSSRLVFQPEWPSSDICDLWSVPITTLGGAVRLTEFDFSAATGQVRKYQISPDGKQVVYSQDPDGLSELYTVPIGGPASASQKLNGTLVSGGDVLSWDLSPDGCNVVYKADQDTDNVNELYIAPHPCTAPTPPFSLFLPLIDRG